MQRMRDSEFYAGLASRLERGLDFPQAGLIAHLVSVGYEKQETVESPGQFALRGGIVDVFSPETAAPVRLEFFGDTLESLREFDANTQRSLRPLERLTLLPLTDYPRRVELLERLQAPGVTGREDEGVPAAFYPGWEFHPALLGDAKSSLFELAAEAAVLEDEPDELRRAMEEYRARLESARRVATGALNDVPAERYVMSGDEWAAELRRRPRLRLEHLALEGETPAREMLSQPTTRYHGNVAAFMAEVRGRVQGGAQVMVSAASTGEMERLADLCHENELPYRLGELDDTATGVRLAEESSGGTNPALVLCKAPLSEGVAFPESRLAIYGNADLFESLPAPARTRGRATSASFTSDFSELKPGDYVVHVDHGIGQFDGLCKRSRAMAGAPSSCVCDTPTTRACTCRWNAWTWCRPIASVEGAKPALDRLGGTAWATRKSRVRKSLTDMADKLLELYAERKAAPGFAFSADTPWQREFEDAFEFTETPDQAIADRRHQARHGARAPMDRLLCGDVGYGKTEVAMRAAFKAVCDSKQVAVLAPTTILVFQHYETFRRRMTAFPVKIEMISRFRSATEQKKIIAAVEEGKSRYSHRHAPPALQGCALS